MRSGSSRQLVRMERDRWRRISCRTLSVGQKESEEDFLWALPGFARKSVQRLESGPVDLCDLLQPGTHGTTFGGTPLACAASLAVLETIEKEGLLANARLQGDYAKRKIETVPGVKEVRGMGLMLGIELGDEFGPLAAGAKAPSQMAVIALMRNGLLAVPAGPTVIRWLPPLNVSAKEIDEAVSILRGTLTAMVS